MEKATMKRKPSGNEIQSLLDAIKASDVVESRTQLISELGELDVTDENERVSILECIATFWEDFTCLDVSQCMLNKTILKVATTYLESDTSKCLSQLLALGTKATIWCRKHMKMTLMSTDDSQEEEHYGLFFQVLLDMLCHSAAVLSTLARHPVSTGKDIMAMIQTSILEILNLTKDSILEVKRIQAHGSEVLKASQVVLEALISLCKSYCNNLNSNHDDKESNQMNHIINITESTIQNLVDLGVVAANAGGNLVTVLNISWKGVVTLLQLCKGTLELKMNISDIILSLISLAKGSLTHAAQTWSCLMEPVSMSEAKRIFIPAKFYLINAARIISHYPSQAFLIFKDITLCIITILTFKIFLCKEEFLKSASEALGELLEPTSIHLLNSLLNSSQLKQEHKHQILDFLFTDINTSSFVSSDQSTTMDSIFSLTFGSKPLLIGQVFLFITLLKSAPDVEDDVKLEIAKKMEWILNILTDEDVYSSVLALQLPLFHGSDQNMYCSIIHAMKTFMLVVSSTSIWEEFFFKSFLLENLLHPHHLCWEIVMELWCFMIRHSEAELGNEIIDKLCMLLKTTASWESVLNHDSVLRKLSKSICRIVRHGSESMADRVFNFIVNGDVSRLSSVMFTALLMEGFPLNLLSNKVKSVAKQRIVMEYFQFLDGFEDESRKCGIGIFGAPVFAMSAAVQSLQVSISDTEMKTINLLISIIHKYKNNTHNSKYQNLLNETLAIISTMKHLYTSEEMGTLIVNLQTLFTSDSDSSDKLSKCKANLAAFISGFGHIEYEVTDTNPKFSSSWKLFHMLLKERHWALSHLAITAFGYFSARTNCDELWRFVPQDAALSFDLESGVEANGERFMSEFTVSYEKETGVYVKPNHGKNELPLLVKQGLMLRKMVEKKMVIVDKMEIDHDDDDDEMFKRRKIHDGVEKLKDGLRVFANGIMLLQENRFDFSDVDGEFLTHFSHIQDTVGRMAENISKTK
ncbi:uncharacterized protein LOC111879570 [Lactuca sativa]|nr:uncharacterized protein LOC111879570 [Lactuca sativa]